MATERVDIDPETTTVLIRLLESGVPKFKFGTLSNISVANRKLDSSKTTLTSTSDFIVINSELPSFQEAQDTIDVKGTFGVSAEFTDGTVLSSDHALATDLQSKDDGHFLGVRAFGARVTRGATRPRYWGAELNFGLPNRFGNLQVWRDSPNGARKIWNANLRLSGAYTWYVLNPNRGEERILLVDLGSGERTLDLKTLASDFLALQFALGRPLYIPKFVALDSAGEACGWWGASLGMPLVRKSMVRPPTPSTHLEWSMVELFEHASLALREKQIVRLDVALTYYLESLWEHLDGAYLKLQVALEATADRWLKHTNSPPSPPLVPDFEAWQQWINLNETAIKDLAQEGKKAQLVKKIRSQGRAPSSTKVELAFKWFKVSLNDSLLDEVNGRNTVSHAALMSGIGSEDRDIIKDLARVGTVRVLLAVLTSLIIEYRGPLLGPDIRDEQAADQTLWTPDPKFPNSRRQYTARAVHGEAPLSPQWTASGWHGAWMDWAMRWWLWIRSSWRCTQRK